MITEKERDNLGMLSPEAEIETNEHGGSQSKATMRFDLLDAGAMMQLAGIAAGGAEKYGIDNWRKIETRDHVNHAVAHFYAFLSGDTQDDHLGHAFCRSMMALAVENQGGAFRE